MRDAACRACGRFALAVPLLEAAAGVDLGAAAALVRDVQRRLREGAAPKGQADRLDGALVHLGGQPGPAQTFLSAVSVGVRLLDVQRGEE